MEEYLRRLHIHALKPMQQEALETIRPNRHVVLISPTGSGKTLAFLLPVLRLLSSDLQKVQALIITPSRELALQIEKVFRSMQTGVKVNSCYGGHPMRIEKNNLSTPPPLLIGTPGRIADHLRRNSFDPANIKTLVLDEFDKSLELGFKEEMEFIIRSLKNVNARILTSATGIDPIPDFALLKDPVLLDYSEHKSSGQIAYHILRAEGTDKLDLLFRLICHLEDQSDVVFCNHREAVERFSALLSDKGIAHGIFHGGMEQENRELALARFRNGSHHLLLSTDLASRGLDIPEIRNVIHYQLPVSANAWTHRNGRTARMNADGKIWLILAAEDYLPDFITEEVQQITLPEQVKLPPPTLWETLYISAGRKDKISKGDIAGFFMQVAELQKDDLGRIEVLDYASLAAVKRSQVREVLKKVKGQLLKRKNVKIEVARD